MPKIISYLSQQSPIVKDDDWQVLRPSNSDEKIDLLDGKWVVPFTTWIKFHQEYSWQTKIARKEISVWFGVEDDVQELLPSIEGFIKQWPLIAIDFPIYRDGRGFSTAAILRKRATWTGEIRAIGDVLVDQLTQMARVGFDTFALRSDQSFEVGIAQFSLYTVRMQNDWRNQRSQLEVVG
jgi:uncharacterized protein (DUF934 family)